MEESKESNEIKQVIVVRKDLKLPKGKLAVQVAHASVECVIKSDKDTIHTWYNNGMKKVVVYVNDLKELLRLKTFADQAGLTNALIRDAGRTVVAPGTITCLGIGPDYSKKIDELTKDLPIL